MHAWCPKNVGLVYNGVDGSIITVAAATTAAAAAAAATGALSTADTAVATTTAATAAAVRRPHRPIPLPWPVAAKRLLVAGQHLSLLVQH